MQPSIIFAILCALASFACHRKAAAHADHHFSEPIASVETTIAVPGPTPEILTLTGTIASNQRSEVTADTQGKVLAVLVERGQRVKRGQPVVRLDVSGASLHTAEASAQLDTARAAQQLANGECERSRKLYAMGAISGSEAERQQSQCTSAAAQVDAARARSAITGKSVRDGLVRAPFDGVVVEREVTAGEWVTPGRSLFTLIDAGSIIVELTVPESHIESIRLGQRVELSTVARRSATYHATVTRLGAEVGRARALTIEATVEGGQDLVPGLFVEARVVTGHALYPVLPASAVVRRGATWHAFVVHENIVEERIVELGPSPGPGTVSIVQSIASGERVVATVTDQITDGLRVH